MAVPSAFGYERALNDLQQQHAATQGVAEFGRAMGQRRFERQRKDLQTGFSQSQPNFGGSFARRGMLNSGMYKQGLRDRYQQYQQTQADLAGQQQLTDMEWSNQARQRDTNYQNALLRLMEEFQASRAMQNPFEDFRMPFGNISFEGTQFGNVAAPSGGLSLAGGSRPPIPQRPEGGPGQLRGGGNEVSIQPVPGPSNRPTARPTLPPNMVPSVQRPDRWADQEPRVTVPVEDMLINRPTWGAGGSGPLRIR